MRILGKYLIGVGSGLALLATGAMAPQAGAGEIEDFYKGKTIHWRVGSSAGGNYALYGRSLAKALSKYIPGNPKVIVQFNPRGGGRQEASYVSNVAPRDGSVIGTTQQNVPVFYLLDPKGMKFDVTKWQWIGNAAQVTGALGVWHTAPATTLSALKKTQVVIGATGLTSETFMNPKMANIFVGTKFKMVIGYRGSGPLLKAIESGETHGVSISYHTFAVRKAEWTRNNKIRLIFQTGLEADPRIKNVPVLWTLGRTEMDRAAMKMISTSVKFGRSLWFPEGVPKARLNALRAAFDKAVLDPVYQARISKSKLPLNPIPGVEMEKVAQTLFATPAKVVAHARAALGIRQK